MKVYFINEAFDKAIDDYLKSKDKKESILYNSFLVVVIRMLVNIYGELDIINPYKIKHIESFNDNLMKFGMNEKNLLEFKRSLDGFYRIEKKNLSSIRREDNVYFIEVQKILIDMFNLKRINYGVTERDRKVFFDLLYTPGTTNALRISYNYLNAPDVYEIAEYFKKVTKEEKKIQKSKKEKDLLSFEAYKLFGINISQLSKMDDNEISRINREIYQSFDIKENTINKEYLLNQSIKEYKIRQTPVTTGNGYVDILLVMSLVVTTIMIMIIFGTIIF